MTERNQEPIRNSLPGEEHFADDDGRADSDGFEDHWFELVFDNVIANYRAKCRCGEAFGASAYVGTLADAFDEHVGDRAADWWRQ